MAEEKRHGGARPGSGRPAGRNQEPMSFRIDSDLVEYLKGVDNKNRYVNNLIRSHMEAHSPKESDTKRKKSSISSL
jgi:hypothetical protein